MKKKEVAPKKTKKEVDPSKPKRKMPEGVKKWQEHLSAYRKAHPDVKMKDAMIEAKKTYKK